MGAKEEEKRLQRENVEKRRYLFAKDREGRWSFNRSGTVLSPVWVECSPYEVMLLEQ